MNQNKISSDFVRLQIPMLMINSLLYKTSVVKFNHLQGKVSLKMIDCPGINDVMIDSNYATIVMKFPLRSPFTCNIITQDGFITKKQIIDQVRAAYRQQYKLINLSEANQSEATLLHPLKNLYIDNVYYSTEKNIIIANVDGVESIINNYPF